MEYVSGKISVLMAVHNSARTLRQAVDSILAQTYQNWQFIICDDCSSDNTLDILREYEKNFPGKFKIVRNEKNIFLAASLNHCLQYADGEFSARMDGDDYVSPLRFEHQVKYLKGHPEVQMVGTLRQAFQGDTLGEVIGSYKEFPDQYELRFGSCFAHASIMMYTRVYHALGGYTVSPRTVRSQDYDLWIKFFAHGYKGANMQEVLFFERVDAHSFVRRKPKTYLWQIASRWICFTTLHYPLRYYWRILLPLGHLTVNECRKIRAAILGKA